MLWLFRFFGMNHQAVMGGAAAPVGFILLEDSVSKLLMEDNVSRVTMEA